MVPPSARSTGTTGSLRSTVGDEALRPDSITRSGRRGAPTRPSGSSTFTAAIASLARSTRTRSSSRSRRCSRRQLRARSSRTRARLNLSLDRQSRSSLRSRTTICSSVARCWNQGFLSEANAEWVNTVVARYVEPSQQWTDHACSGRSQHGDILADGRRAKRASPFAWSATSSRRLRVAEINRRLGRLWGRANVKLGPRFCELEDGDWIAWTSARYFAGGTKIFRIEAYGSTRSGRSASRCARSREAFTPTTRSSRAMNRSPHRRRHRPISARQTATTGPWRPWSRSSSLSASIPALEITGSSADDDEWRRHDHLRILAITTASPTPRSIPTAIPWIECREVHGKHYDKGRHHQHRRRGHLYYAAVSYIVGGEAGDRLVLGPVTVAGFSVVPPDSADTTVLTADDTIHSVDLA
jgi:hypothetical protein